MALDGNNTHIGEEKNIVRCKVFFNYLQCWNVVVVVNIAVSCFVIFTSLEISLLWSI